MKKISLIIIGFVTLLSSCTKDLADQFKDPTKVDPPAGNLFAAEFTKMLYNWKLFVKDYGEYWWENQGNQIANYSQINQRYISSRYSWYSDYNDLVNDNGFYSDGNGAVSHFNDHYTRMKEWALMRDALPSLSTATQADVLVYYQLSTVLKGLWTLRCVDLFNKIPYFDALKGSQGVLFPKYDDPHLIYDSVLTDFKHVAATLKATYNGMSATAKGLFATQDIAFGGNIDTWVQYVNAIRLQYAVKLAGVDPSFAVPHITDALTNLPTSDLSFSTHTTDVFPGGGTWLRGVGEQIRVHFIPKIIMDRMNPGTPAYEPGTDDPRLPVLALPTKYNDYRGVTMNIDSNNVYYHAGDYYNGVTDLNKALSTNTRSMYNFATFVWNSANFPAVMITLAEIDLLKAEVALKGYATTGKASGDHIKDAVINSCNFWYGINAMASGYRPDVPVVHPAKVAGNIATYSDIVKANFNAQAGIENQMEVLMQQKYIHLNISNTYELWAELRRTRHPLLEPFVWQGVAMRPCPERIKYPASELLTNQDQYLKVKDQDNYTTPIFWVPANKVGVVYYQ